MAAGTAKHVALIRGDSLNEWEGALWGCLDNDFTVTGFCSGKNLYSTSRLPFPVVRLAANTDNRFRRRFDFYLRGSMQMMRGLEHELQSFDIAHTAEIYYAYTNQAVRAKKTNSRLRVVTTVWDNSFGRFEYNYWPGFRVPPAYWRKKIHALIEENARGVDLFLPVSDTSAELLISLGVSENKIRVLSPAIQKMPDTRTAIVEQLGLDRKNIYLMVNRLVKEKGVYDILYAWKRYVAQGLDPDAVLVIVGAGPELANMVRLAREWGLEKYICFAGTLPNADVRSLFVFARCLLLGSVSTPVWQEQFGYVLAEAIVSGCPVVAARSGSIPEVVGTAGLLYDAGNPMHLYQQLLALNAGNMIETLRASATTQAERYDATRFIERLKMIYQTVV